MRAVINEVVSKPIAGSNTCEKTTKGGEFGCRRNFLPIINALNLIVSFYSETCLVAFNGRIKLVLDFVYPFAINRFSSLPLLCFSNNKNKNIALNTLFEQAMKISITKETFMVLPLNSGGSIS